MRRVTIIKVLTALFVIMVIFSSFLIPVKADNETSSLEAANSSLNQAFASVLAAEEVGGNVTELLFRLNNAGNLLVEAENTYNSGSLVNVVSSAENAQLIANQVKDDAIVLRAAILETLQSKFWLTLFFSVFCSIVFVIVLWFSWQRFKRRFMNRLLGTKPEVVEYAS